MLSEWVVQHHPGSRQLRRAHEYIMGCTCACGPTVVRCWIGTSGLPGKHPRVGAYDYEKHAEDDDASTRLTTPHPPRLLRFAANSSIGIPWLYLPSTYWTDLLQHKCLSLPRVKYFRRYASVSDIPSSTVGTSFNLHSLPSIAQYYPHLPCP